MPLIHPSPIILLTSRDAEAISRRPSDDPSLVRVRHGVYAGLAEWQALAPWNRYLARVHAAAMSLGDVVFSHESAAALLGLPVFGEPAHIHLLDETGHTRRFGDVIVHSATGHRDIEGSAGLSMTSLADTTVDLARLLPPAYGLAVADAALRRLESEGRVLAVDEIAARQRTTRGARRLQWVAENATPVAESPGESVSRAVIGWLGFEAPELQVTFAVEGFVDRCDFFWRHQNVAGESDGYGKYPADPALARAALLLEKKREDRLRRRLDDLARWDWDDAHLVEPLDQKLHAAGLRPVTRRNEAALATMWALRPRR
ncbi:hypothetical protein [Microbacterium invictum]|uniref:AbiEi antitoxin C-terminal domain-containing protein n=1 Tax=Microbacterium invictum TaxID=515415 RepID=A0ABZ0VJ44_9MICO|nr:hypothetical protein [Microbacterium invictum]WQB71782.1 hypothetical protein T9R20_07485 [Microbacterium invictum]